MHLLSGMLSRRNWICVLLVVVVAVTRFLFRSQYLYDLDSVNFALAVQRFDPTVHQPHPPGYFLYVWMARLANTVLSDTNTALVSVSLVSSCAAVVFIYLLGRRWFNDTAALFGGLLFVFSPLSWFHGTVALIYMVEGCLSALVGYLCWRVYKGESWFVIPAAAALGFGAGVRPSFSLFVTPLFLFSLRKTAPKKIFAGIAVLLAAIASWFIPMIEASGGFQAYASSFLALWHSAGGRETVFNSSPLTSLARILAIVLGYIACFGCAVLLSGNAFDRANPETRDQRLFTLVWVTPGLLFFSFIFMIFVNSGYLLVVFVPLFLWFGAWISHWYSRLVMPPALKITVVALLAAINTLVYLESPAYCSYRSVRAFETEIEVLKSTVPQIAKPERTLIIGFDSHFLGFRHAGYYLPSFSVPEYPEVKTGSGKGIFVMHGRDTSLVKSLGPKSQTEFMFFPLPSDEQAYATYLAKVEAKFPPGHLRTVRAGNHDFIFGPIADLPYLFPDAAPKSVYTAQHVVAKGVYTR